IYAASEQPIPGVSSKLIIDQMPVADRRKAKQVKTSDDLAFQLMQMLEPGDVVFTLGAGTITNLGTELLDRMRMRAHQLAELTAQPAV
ncbi:MAG TPA: hypothetical protein PLY73_13660, partial [Candidatus Ozemobacteraceae bacterium]|nr:hypothetical protein [Candidatus Ozemobacteraceae bacterium]